MNQSTVVPTYKRYAHSFLLALCLLQTESYAYASQDLTEVRKMAEEGDAKAQLSLAISYEEGEVVAKDDKQAVVWFLKAAEQGDPTAQFNLGFRYANGEGVVQNFKQAAAWYRKAAEQGDSTAQCSLGLMYIEGQGVPKDYSQAYVWFSVAVANGATGAKQLRNTLTKKLTSAELEAAQELAGNYFKQYQPKK